MGGIHLWQKLLGKALPLLPVRASEADNNFRCWICDPESWYAPLLCMSMIITSVSQHYLSFALM